jgi:hypothetical protein
LRAPSALEHPSASLGTGQAVRSCWAPALRAARRSAWKPSRRFERVVNLYPFDYGTTSSLAWPLLNLGKKTKRGWATTYCCSVGPTVPTPWLAGAGCSQAVVVGY